MWHSTAVLSQTRPTTTNTEVTSFIMAILTRFQNTREIVSTWRISKPTPPLRAISRPGTRFVDFIKNLKYFFSFFIKYTSFIDCCTRSAYWKPKTDSWKKNVRRIDGESQVRNWKILKWSSLKTEPLCFKHLHFHCRH